MNQTKWTVKNNCLSGWIYEQSIQEWNKQNLWKTAFKKFEVIE